MRVVGDDEMPEWTAALLTKAQRDAETLVPRPGCPIYGLASPELRPVIVSRSSQMNGQWEQVTLRYGDTVVGPFVDVTTEQAADEVVTSVINHLGHLAEKAPWFTADGGLREAAIDETLRHAMLGDAVRSEAAQLAWARYWSAGPARTGRQPDSATMRAELEARRALEADWLAAWAAWTGQAPS